MSAEALPLTDLKRFQTFLLLPLEKKQQAAKKKAAEAKHKKLDKLCKRANI